MKIKDAAQLEPLLVGQKARKNGRGGALDESRSDARSGDAVQTDNLNDTLNLDQMKSERQQRVADIKKQVEAGLYFKSRDMNKIALSVFSGISEHVDILKSVGGEE